MKKSTLKALKLEIKPVFEFSAADNRRQDLSDPVTVTVMTITTVVNKLDAK